MADEKSSADLVAQVRRRVHVRRGGARPRRPRGGRRKPDPAAKVRIPLAMLNRHGLVAGATGTGKTKTLQVMAEQLSAAGVPVFLADIKGDVSGMAVAGAAQREDHRADRRDRAGLEADRVPGGVLRPRRQGHRHPGAGHRSPPSARCCWPRCWTCPTYSPRRLNLIFHFADKNGLPLLDIKDLRSVIQYLISDEGADAAAEPRRAVQGRRRACCCAS